MGDWRLIHYFRGEPVAGAELEATDEPHICT